MSRTQGSKENKHRPVCPCGYCTGKPGPMFKHLAPIEAVQVHRTGSRKHGATQKQFQEFVRAADAGLRVEMHGQNYVAMSRNMYEELIARGHPVTVTMSEFQDLTSEEIDELYKGITS